MGSFLDPARGAPARLRALLARGEPLLVPGAYDALSARSPRTQIAIGIGSGGHAGVGVATEFSPDYLSGRTPSQAFDACVRRRSGQAPTTPLAHQRGWIG